VELFLWYPYIWSEIEPEQSSRDGDKTLQHVTRVFVTISIYSNDGERLKQGYECWSPLIDFHLVQWSYRLRSGGIACAWRLRDVPENEYYK